MVRRSRQETYLPSMGAESMVLAAPGSPGAASRGLHQLGVQGDIGVQHLGNRTSLFCILCGFVELCLVGARNLRLQVEMNPGYRKSVAHFLQCDRRRGVDAFS